MMGIWKLHAQLNTAREQLLLEAFNMPETLDAETLRRVSLALAETCNLVDSALAFLQVVLKATYLKASIFAMLLAIGVGIGIGVGICIGQLAA